MLNQNILVDSKRRSIYSWTTGAARPTYGNESQTLYYFIVLNVNRVRANHNPSILFFKASHLEIRKNIPIQVHQYFFCHEHINTCVCQATNHYISSNVN